MTARSIAYKVLLQVERADAYLNLALDAALRASGNIARQDAVLATEICYGVYRRAMALDSTIASYSTRSPKKLETGVLVALRIGAYQLLYLDRVPEHAAVDTTVELVKKQGLGRASGLVNAVLRKIANEKKVQLPQDALERLSVEESHPAWLVRRWIERLGFEDTVALCRADNQAPPVCVRVNSTRATRDQVVEALAQAGVVARPTRYSPLGLWLEDCGPIASLKPFRQGLFQVQDEAAQLVSLLAGASPGMRILDACAAPGSKTCHLAEQMKGQGELMAVDLYPRKLQKLEEEATRLGVISCIRLRAADASRALPFDQRSFDMVVLDAPCSGLGTLRRHPELRYRRRPDDIERLAQVQRTLAVNLSRYLKPGGSFVFAVCSTEPEEGYEQAAKLVVDGFSISSPASSDVPWETLQAQDGAFTTYPHRHGTDGFYATKLVKN